MRSSGPLRDPCAPCGGRRTRSYRSRRRSAYVRLLQLAAAIGAPADTPRCQAARGPTWVRCLHGDRMAPHSRANSGSRGFPVPLSWRGSGLSDCFPYESGRVSRNTSTSGTARDAHRGGKQDSVQAEVLPHGARTTIKPGRAELCLRPEERLTQLSGTSSEQLAYGPTGQLVRPTLGPATNYYMGGHLTIAAGRASVHAVVGGSRVATVSSATVLY